MRFNPLRLAFLLNAVWWWIVRPVQLGVRIILVQDGKVLMVRHTYMRGWHFPGGGIKRLETPLEAAAREAKEEAGVELLEAPTLLRIVTSYAGGRSDHVAVYLCRKFRIELATDRWEIAECKLFALDALPSPIGNIWLKLLQELAVSDSSAL
jgi:8-oxo-dGTP pyrophosphatase MutT (NUDIX family)